MKLCDYPTQDTLRFNKYLELKDSTHYREGYRFAKINEDFIVPEGNEYSTSEPPRIFSKTIKFSELPDKDLINQFSEAEDAFKDDALYQLVRSHTKQIKILIVEGHQQIQLQYDQPNLSHCRLEIYVKTGSKLILLENLTGSSPLMSHSLNIKVDHNSNFEHYRIQNIGLESNYLSFTQVQLAKDAHYHHVNATLSASSSRQNFQIQLNGTNAQAGFYGFSFLNNSQTCEVNTGITHHAAHTYSNQVFKSLLADQSRNIFIGNIFVKKEAQQIVSKQLNKNLLLSRKARAFSQPQLEIYADDVKCSHGSTTGQIDQEELFYLNQRALPEQKAKQMLAQAFINEVLLQINHEGVLSRATEDFYQKFQNLEKSK